MWLLSTRVPLRRLPGSSTRAPFARLVRQYAVCLSLARASVRRLPGSSASVPFAWLERQRAVCPTWLERCTTFTPLGSSVACHLPSKPNPMLLAYVHRLLFHHNSIAWTARVPICAICHFITIQQQGRPDCLHRLPTFHFALFIFFLYLCLTFVFM